MEPTELERRVYEALKVMIGERHGVPPTQQELADATGINISHVNRHLRVLQGLGFIGRAGGRNSPKSFYIAKPLPRRKSN